MARAAMDYFSSLNAEKRFYSDCAEVHDLPPVFHYWSHKHLAPMVAGFGYASPDDVFFRNLASECERRPAARFLSAGSGNCDLEVRLATALLERGYSSFTLECADLNPAMLDRGRAMAEREGASGRMIFTEADLNRWSPEREYHAVIANQSLHHLLDLEGFFAGVRAALAPGGSFIMSDMIGRNGHLRWPEALGIVYEFWRELPPSYRFNRQLHRYEELFEDWDSSGDSFEGIRSQDILPLLLATFHFRLFIPFGNVIDPFVDRSFGFHFDPSTEWDREFIDRVHGRDVHEIANGTIKPTHMIAIVANEPCECPEYPGRLSPEFCRRDPGRVVDQPQRPDDPFDWERIPQDKLKETIAWRRLGSLEQDLRSATDRALDLQRQLEARTESGVQLQRERAEFAAHASHLEKLWLERTEWAMSLESELERVTAIAEHYQGEAARETARANALEAELLRCSHNPVVYFSRKLIRSARRRLGSLR